MEIKKLLYGENAWQTPARFEPDPDCEDPLSLANFELVAGTEPSYNNLCDVDRMLQTITHLAAAYELNVERIPYTALGVKHGNPCGAAISYHAGDAIKKMLEGDPLAIFGGLVMLDFIMSEENAELLLSHKVSGGSRRLLDGVVAGMFDGKAVEMLKRKGDKCRFLANKALLELSSRSVDSARRFRYVRGGKLTQPNYTWIPNFEQLAAISGKLDYQIVRDFCLAWAVGSTSNSNTITLVKDGMLLGSGVGQQDRVGAADLAIARAQRSGHDIRGSAAYSDSFFPFTDGPEKLIAAGVRAIFTSSGSVKDNEVIALCQKAGVTLCMVNDKVGRGFFGH